MAIEKTVKNVNLLKNSAKTCHNKIEKKNCVQKIGKKQDFTFIIIKPWLITIKQWYIF